MKPKSNTDPRFVWNIGAVSEEYPDMPEQERGTVLWDRQEKKPVVTLHREYGNAFCLEVTRSPNDMPLTILAEWFNQLRNDDMDSEDLAMTNCVHCGHPLQDTDEGGKRCAYVRCIENPAP